MSMKISNRVSTDGIEVIRQNFSDIDQQAACLSGYDQRYQQLSCGKFVGQFKTAIVDSKLGLYFEMINQILDQSGAVPPNHYSVILLMNDDGCCKWNGQTFSSHDLWYGAPGSTFNAISVPGTQFVVVNIEKEFFETMFIGNYPELRNYPAKYKFGILEDNRTNAHRLRQVINQIFIILKTSSHGFAKSLSIKCLRLSITEMIADQLYNVLHPMSENKVISLSNRFQIAKYACAYINDHRGIDISISDLCRLTNVSRRTLEYSFHDCIGQSPASYLRSIKLNEIRRALLSPENTRKSIGDIVSDWGVWHLSRFAQYYRNQFNELPSETRKFSLS
jgi:AraC family transcriptional regulator, ethanolamine operon transcriptional activator